MLVTGSGDFIGGYLVNDLVSKGHNVIVEDIKPADEWFQVSCDANNHALCMESVLIQTHMPMAARNNGVLEILYTSSTCVNPVEAQLDIKDAQAQRLKEKHAYPANPENGYGWEKLFSEIITQYFDKDFGLDHRICRFHNIYGHHGTWQGDGRKCQRHYAARSLKPKEAVIM